MLLIVLLKNTLSTCFSGKTIWLLALSLLTSSAFGQTYHFAAHGGGSNKDEFLDFKVDDAENSYVLLKYEADVTFGNDTYTHPSKNTLIAKFDKDGNQLMTRNIIAEWPNFIFGALGVSGDGLVVVAARTKTGSLDGHEVYGGNFIGKLDDDGEFEWILQPIDSIEGARQFTQFRVTAIEVTQNEIYVAATAGGKITLNGVTDPGYAHDNVQSALLIKLNLDGDVLWIKNIPTPEVANHPTIDSGMDHILPSRDGEHIYVAGKVGDGSYNPYEVAYVAKFKTDGTFLWVKKTSSSGSDSWGIAEASNGDVVSGFGIGGAQLIDFGGDAKLEPSDTGWFGGLIRIDKDGNVKALAYVTDALYADPGSIGAQNLLRLFHLTVDASDQVILTGQISGTHTFKNELEVSSTQGLAGASKDAAIIICDLNFNPISVYADTGGNNEAGRKVVRKGEKIYYSGEYDSYRHQFFGTFQAKFGDFIFESAGDLDIFVASLVVPIPPTPPERRLIIAKQADAYILSWPSIINNAILEFSTSLYPDTWDVLDLTPSLEDDFWKLALPETNDSGFYRLRYEE